MVNVLNFLLDFIRVSLILPLFKPGKLKKHLPILKYGKHLLNLFFSWCFSKGFLPSETLLCTL